LHQPQSHTGFHWRTIDIFAHQGASESASSVGGRLLRQIFPQFEMNLSTIHNSDSHILILRILTMIMIVQAKDFRSALIGKSTGTKSLFHIPITRRLWDL
jgi:hypothetical protein